MTFNHALRSGDVLSNRQLTKIFECSTQGVMRQALETNMLSIISNHIEAVYEDNWHGDIFHYTDMRLTGEQSLNFAQNKTLTQSRDNGVEVFEPKTYTFLGQVELKADPYQEDQPDSEGRPRKVWVFPIGLKGGPVNLEHSIIEKKDRIIEKKLND